jgi:23S rRNA-intervening sequence protein
MTQQSPIFVKTEVFMVWLFNHTANFPRQERFRLATHIDETIFDFHEQLLRAAYADQPLEHLREADLQLTKLRTYLRLAVELKYTAPRQYQYIAEQTTEIGKLLGGWIKKA